MTYRLRVTARAVADADKAHEWIAEHISPASGRTLVSGSLQANGDADPPALPVPVWRPRVINSPIELRELLFGKRNFKYRIIFTIRR